MNLRYEKPTARRRREKIESNRKLFGAMVKKKVALIMQMKFRWVDFFFFFCIMFFVWPFSERANLSPDSIIHHDLHRGM